MKRTDPQQTTTEAPILKDMHFVHKGGPSVRVRHYTIDDGRGVRFSAELTSVEAGVERAIIDASSYEELSHLIEIASRAFALAIRLRRPAG
jgi:hypothetical protein